MTALFADTFYWIALTDIMDSSHQNALDQALKHTEALIVTTDEVLVEFLTFFTAPEPMRRKAVVIAQAILNDPGVRVIPQTRDSFLLGMQLYARRPDKRYSLTDCISMQTMRSQGITVDPVFHSLIEMPTTAKQMAQQAIENRVLAYTIAGQLSESKIQAFNKMRKGVTSRLRQANKKLAPLYTIVHRPIMIASEEKIEISSRSQSETSTTCSEPCSTLWLK